MATASEHRAVHHMLLAPMMLASCFLLWLVFIGNFHRNDLIVGALSVLPTTAFVVFVKLHENIELEFSARDALQSLWVPWYITSGLLEILTVLFKDLSRLQPAKSLFLVSKFQSFKDPHGNGRRVLAVLYTTATPNFIVISIDLDQKQMLYHQLEKSSIPRMTINLGAAE